MLSVFNALNPHLLKNSSDAEDVSAETFHICKHLHMYVSGMSFKSYNWPAKSETNSGYGTFPHMETLAYV